jgi:hypothetical protein
MRGVVGRRPLIYPQCYPQSNGQAANRCRAVETRGLIGYDIDMSPVTIHVFLVTGGFVLLGATIIWSLQLHLSKRQPTKLDLVLLRASQAGLVVVAALWDRLT